MSQKYADRAFIHVNGVEMLDVESSTLRQNDGSKPVPTMSRDRRNKGFVQGNREIDINVVTAVANKVASVKLEEIDFENNDVGITYECGADRYTAIGVFHKDSELASSGVGSEVKKTFNLGALDLVDQVGNPVNFNISF